MQFLDETLGTLGENLALDEALLLEAEKGGPEVLRLWEWPHYAVVLGAGCKLAEDVNEDACRAHQVPIYRRGSGGGTVLLGPGCLIFSLVLSFDRDPALKDVRASYRWVLGKLAGAFSQEGIAVHHAGTSDFVMGEHKISGNSQQRKRNHVLHHGTLLYQFDLKVVERYLHLPGRQPEYRRHRPHQDFLANLPMAGEEIRRILKQAWDIQGLLPTLPQDTIQQLIREKYCKDEWIRVR